MIILLIQYVLMHKGDVCQLAVNTLGYDEWIIPYVIDDDETHKELTSLSTFLRVGPLDVPGCPFDQRFAGHVFGSGNGRSDCGSNLVKVGAEFPLMTLFGWRWAIVENLASLTNGVVALGCCFFFDVVIVIVRGRL